MHAIIFLLFTVTAVASAQLPSCEKVDPKLINPHERNKEHALYDASKCVIEDEDLFSVHCGQGPSGSVATLEVPTLDTKIFGVIGGKLLTITRISVKVDRCSNPWKGTFAPSFSLHGPLKSWCDPECSAELVYFEGPDKDNGEYTKTLNKRIAGYGVPIVGAALPKWTGSLTLQVKVTSDNKNEANITVYAGLCIGLLGCFDDGQVGGRNNMLTQVLDVSLGMNDKLDTCCLPEANLCAVDKAVCAEKAKQEKENPDINLSGVETLPPGATGGDTATAGAGGGGGGATAAIVIVIFLVIVALLAVGAFLFYKRGGRNRQNELASASKSGVMDTMEIARPRARTRTRSGTASGMGGRRNSVARRSTRSGTLTGARRAPPPVPPAAAVAPPPIPVRPGQYDRVPYATLPGQQQQQQQQQQPGGGQYARMPGQYGQVPSAGGRGAPPPVPGRGRGGMGRGGRGRGGMGRGRGRGGAPMPPPRNQYAQMPQ